MVVGDHSWNDIESFDSVNTACDYYLVKCTNKSIKQQTYFQCFKKDVIAKIKDRIGSLYNSTGLTYYVNIAHNLCNDIERYRSEYKSYVY